MAAPVTGKITLPREFTICGVFPGSTVLKNAPANAGYIRQGLYMIYFKMLKETRYKGLKESMTMMSD